VPGLNPAHDLQRAAKPACLRRHGGLLRISEAGSPQSCNDYTYDDECWNTEVVEGNEPANVTISEELSPINESNTDIVIDAFVGRQYKHRSNK
jgi:hypothetical protein